MKEYIYGNEYKTVVNEWGVPIAILHNGERYPINVTQRSLLINLYDSAAMLCIQEELQDALDECYEFKGTCGIMEVKK